MNEIDLYVELIDDKTANKILKQFNETVPGFSRNPSLKQKKNHIRNIFRGQISNIRKKQKTKGNPFYSHLSWYKTQKNDERFGLYDAKGLFLFLANSDMIPEYAKFAIALIYQPGAVREKLPELIQNHQENKALFATDIVFETQEEVEAFLKAGSSYFTLEGVDDFLEDLKDLSLEDEAARINELTKLISPMTLQEFYNKQHQYRDVPRYILDYVYAKTHPNEKKEIRTGIILQIIYRMMKHQQEMYREAQSKLKIVKEELQNNETIKKESKALLERFREQEKNLRQVEHEKKGLLEELERITNELQQEKKYYENTVQQQNSELEIVRKEQAAANQRIEHFFEECSGESNFEAFAVVYTGESNMFHMLFPEIMAFSMKDWSQNKRLLLNYPKVYFQRDSLNTKLISTIQSYCRKNSIKANFFIARNEKELIELIAHYKRQLLEG